MTGGMFLTQGEIDALCEPLRQPAAQIRFLEASGLTVIVKPNGRPAVVRAHAELVLSGLGASNAAAKPEVGAAPAQPNVDGFLKVIHGGKRHGAPKKVQPA